MAEARRETSTREGAGRLLALDTAGVRAAAALLSDGLVSVRVTASRRGEDLPDLVGSLLEERHLAVADLDGIGVNQGPGSYTGLRLGLGLARGLALIDRLPVVPVGALELAALACPVARSRVVVVLPAAASRAFVGSFARDRDSLQPLEPPRVVAFEELRAAVKVRPPDSILAIEARPIAKNLWDALKDCVADAGLVELPPERAGLLARVAAARLRAGEGMPAERVLPRYLGTSSPRPNRNRVVLEPPVGN